MRKLSLSELKLGLLSSCLAAPLAVPMSAIAQDEDVEQIRDEIIVEGRVITRNRTTSANPELTYDREFFEQYEPISVGDALKRTPGVAFTSDIGEYDAPQLRGLGSGFTQILINGRPVPGAGNDRSILVDRIPAELVERIEIIRSPSAEIDSQGIGGTINIILKDGASLPPGVLGRASALYYNFDEKFRGAGALAYIGRSEDEKLTYALTANVQQRYNPKLTVQEVFSGDNYSSLQAASDAFSDTSAGSVVGDGEERGVQFDTRDNLDISFNADMTYRFDNDSQIAFRGFLIKTDREEREDGLIFEDSPTNLDTIEAQDTKFDQLNFGAEGVYTTPLGQNTELEIGVQYSQFDNSEISDELEADPDDLMVLPTEADLLSDLSINAFGPELQEIEIIESLDKEFQADTKLTHDMPGLASSLGINGVQSKIGFQGKFRDRDSSILVADYDDGVLEPLEPAAGGGVFNLKESRYDGFVAVEWQLSDRARIETGARLEHTITKESGDLFAPITLEDTQLNPSVHLQYDLNDWASFRASFAKTVRRPSFEQRIPFEDSDEPEDDDITRGNPFLTTETAKGFDVGFEFELPGRGIMGINGFYRDIDDLILLVQIDQDPDNDPMTPGGVYSFENVGSAKVYGFEFDLSTSLAAIGLPDTGLFANYTRLYSERFDPNFDRDVRINQQPTYVYNVGVTQSIPNVGVSFGASYQKQGMYTSHFFGEIERGTVDGNLELFVEKRFQDSVVLRLSGNNVLDASSFQTEENFDGDTGDEIIANAIAGNVDGYEIEREQSTPVVQLTLRVAL
jgi:outer membrane receptor protein involved in Fe transport